MNRRPSDLLTPDPDPDYETKLMALQRRLDDIDLSQRDWEFEPSDDMQITRIGELPNKVLRIYALHDKVQTRLGLTRFAIQEEQR